MLVPNESTNKINYTNKKLYLDITWVFAMRYVTN